MTDMTDVMRGEFEAWATAHNLSILRDGVVVDYACLYADRCFVAYQDALKSPAVRELVERFEAVLLRDSDSAPSGAPNDCSCSCLSRNAEREYEAGKCPHQLARKALANFASIAKGDKA